MSHTRGLVEVADVGSYQLALRIDLWHEALNTLPVREPVFGAWPEPSFHPPPSSPLRSRSLLYPDLKQQALLDNNKNLLPSWVLYCCQLWSRDRHTASCVPSEDHIDKDPARQHLNSTDRIRGTSFRPCESYTALYPAT